MDLGGFSFRGLVTSVARSKPDLRPALSSLREPVFRQWFLSQILSSSGSMTQGVALSWLVLQLTGSGVELGLMTSCMFLPLFVMGPFAGRLVDRIGPRRVLIATQILFTVLSVLVAVLAATGATRMWMLFVIAAATGVISAPDSTARQVYVIELVGAERVTSAIALNEVVLNASRVLGPALGGLVLGTLGVAACCVLNALSFLPPLRVVLRHRPERGAPAPQRTESKGGGLRYAWNNPTIRACLVLAAAAGMLFNLNVPVPLLATGVLQLGGAGFGLLMATFGIGSIPGALLAASGPTRPGGRTVAVLAAATGASILATAYAPNVALAFVGMAVTGCVSIWFISSANTLVQLESDPGMRGRVNAAWNMALPGCEPATSPFIGWVAGAAGPRAGFGVAGLALLLAAVLGWRGLTYERRTGHHYIAVPAAVHHPINGAVSP
ncbi:MFS transporter [Dactylosporangium sp. NPDC051484]|uniref:MFS transporter n=1 Tax=Dactylosporangium sp. NPDC051484 TaxID=3154942 RepID=UPI003450EC5C